MGIRGFSGVLGFSGQEYAEFFLFWAGAGDFVASAGVSGICMRNRIGSGDFSGPVAPQIHWVHPPTPVRVPPALPTPKNSRVSIYPLYSIFPLDI